MNKFLMDLHCADYKTACQMLKEKYGTPNGNYFLKENCKSPNQKIKRTAEGLTIHHIKEFSEEYPDSNNLSEPKYAINYPFDFQKAENLVYCNNIEHFILHTKITILRENLVGGFVEDGNIHFIIPTINDSFYGNIVEEVLPDWKRKALEVIKPFKEEYEFILEIYARHYGYTLEDFKRLSFFYDRRTLLDL